MDAAVRSGSGVSAVVEYDYTAKESDELDLVKGALLYNIKQMPGGWWEGTLQTTGKTGMFPDNFVRVIDTNEENTVVLRDKSATANRRCKVIYSYTQVNDDELSLAVGDVIEFLGQVEEGWWRGRLKNKIGVFPSNFVVAIEPSPILASKRPPSSSHATAAAPAAAQATTTTSAMHVANKTATAAATSTAANANNSAVNNVYASNKKTNRLSFHSSKEDLLSSTTSTTATTVDDVAPTLPPKPHREFCRVEFPYAPQNEDELELKTGDIITIISMTLPDKGWWKGELRGKVGVFPDNFVKLLAPSEVSPLHDSQLSHKTAKAASSASTNITSSSSTSSTKASTKSNQSATTSKVFIKKSGSTSSTQSSDRGQSASNRKDSFGSRDSLNDILSETGLQSGNVAATRKSLENKNIDLLNAPDASSRLGMKKHQQQETVSVSTTSTTTTISSSSNSSSTSEMRKSMENMDEKTKTPPPVLTKKPLLGPKGILSGLKQKVKNVEKQLNTAVSHDSADGLGSSKMSPSSGLPDGSVSGNVVMRRSATIAVEDTDFDSVERASILPDMRAGRVKAPRRRPPSTAYNVVGESNNNNSVYLNGSSGGGSSEVLEESAKPQSSDDNSTGDELLAKPKPREWQTQKAPWMEELKASQVKKKTSPNVEPRSHVSGSSSSSTNTAATVMERTKHIAEDTKITSSSNSSSSTSSVISSTSSTTATTKVQSSSVSSSIMQQSMLAESSHQMLRKENTSDAMTKSMSAAKSLLNTDATEDVRTRPNSLSIRNRSVSPSSVVRSTSKPTVSPATSSNASVEAASSNIQQHSSASSTTAAKTTHINNHTSASTIHENNISSVGKHIMSNSSNSQTNANVPSLTKAEGARVLELERRVEKLEAVVQSQQRTIDELVRTLREETDRVKVLRGELDKYAQCVTQV